MRYGYDPGCSRPLEDGPRGAVPRAVAAALGLPFEEIGVPGDCAPREAAMNGIPAYARVGRLLSVAARQLDAGGLGTAAPAVVSPCSACFRNLSRAGLSLARHPDLREQVDEEIAAEGLRFEPGAVRVRHLLDVLYEDAGPEAIRARVKTPLQGLVAAPYYGCLTTRPGLPDPAAGDPANPTRLDEILSALGAVVVPFPLKAHCCGGHAAASSEETATSLVHRILRCAAERNASVIVTVCPVCRQNLESGQEAVNRRFRTRFSIPVRYFADLLEEAFEVKAFGVRS